MERIDDRGEMPAGLRGAILALGNFDGFHHGHQAVVGKAIEWARAEGRPAIVATFDPHPIRLFRPDAPAFQLTTLDQRQRLFEVAGADAMLLFLFTRELAQCSAEQFVERLVGKLGAAGVVTGEDFTFGKDRSGNIARLQELGEQAGLRSETVAPVFDAGGLVISSTRIREALKAGDCETATCLLTRPFAIEGIVQHGDKIGRTIDFPTANLDLRDYVRPAYGIYAVRGRLADGRIVDGCANLGIRPSFDPPKELLEPYFFDFSGDLYGQTIEVQLIEFIRPEAKFDSLEALTAQIARDCDVARAILAKGSPS